MQLLDLLLALRTVYRRIRKTNCLQSPSMPGFARSDNRDGCAYMVLSYPYYLPYAALAAIGLRCIVYPS
jgi:hypothetical protein